MADVLRRLQRFAFDQIPFVVSRYSIRGGARTHIHEFRHTDGGLIEQLGRRLYQIECDAAFSVNNTRKVYQNAWPGDASDLRDRFERQVIGELVIPHIGAIQAQCTDWSTEIDYARMRDGERAKFTFLEDIQAALLAANVVQLAPEGLTFMSEAMVDEAEDLGLDPAPFTSLENLTSAIDDMASDITSFGAAYIDTVTQVIEACVRIDETMEALGRPENWTLARSVRKLGATAIKLKKDVLRKSAPMTTYTTPKEMSVVEVALTLYGETARAKEVMQLNALEDPMRIPPGTVLRVYAPDVSRAA